ncbi:hypothetical protein V8G54_026499 [Vigna mungo]|uniref:Uncharacterized protein n=1 Tax=Vigna mungo TaxID=3915 RepID=A0AAQ3N0P4_VIGMU
MNSVTWKISPVNERLLAVSKHTPEVIKALAASSKMNLSAIRNDSGKEAIFLSTCLDKVASPTPKVPLSFKRINSALDVIGQSPFRTPPSLSYRSDKVVDFLCTNVGAYMFVFLDREWSWNFVLYNRSFHFRGLNYSIGFVQVRTWLHGYGDWVVVQRSKDIEHKRLCDQPLLRQNKKALLELLDQVEDAIAIDDAPVLNSNTYSFKVPQNQAYELPVKDRPVVERTESHLPKEGVDVFSNSNYLVLEVSELRSADSSAAPCSSYKVLRLLNEQSGEERAVNLWNEW